MQFYITLPWFDRIGPISTREPFEVDSVLPPGRYRLFGKLPPDVDVLFEFEITEGSVTTLRLADSVGSLRRLSTKPPEKPPALLMQRRRTHAAHFWLGHCDSDERLGQLLSETRYYELVMEEREEGAFLSEFAETQNARRYDHDDMEAGWDTKGSNLAERFREYSWCEEWVGELDRRAREAGIGNPNCFIMHGGAPDKTADWKLKSPTHVERPGVNLRYLGVIEFDHW